MDQAPARARPVTHKVPDPAAAGPAHPPIPPAIEYGYHAVLGDARAVPAPLVDVLITVLALRHDDTADRTRQAIRRRGSAAA